MILSRSPLKLWLIALGLFLFDGLLIYTYLVQPDQLTVDALHWDFRIAELRSLDQSLVVSQPVVPIGYLLQSYFPESAPVAATVSPLVGTFYPVVHVPPKAIQGMVL